jgi:hypothetical protein
VDRSFPLTRFSKEAIMAKFEASIAQSLFRHGIVDMSAITKLSKGFQLFSWVFANPRTVYNIVSQQQRGEEFSNTFQPSENLLTINANHKPVINRLEEFFNNRTEGNGIWKWRHYFDIYDRHLSKFIGADLSLVEIGVYSGGSLEMWRNYFGDRCKIYGVDISEECTVYEGPKIQIFIGDQEDRAFWRNFRAKASNLDVVIDDGGHSFNQQIVTLEELLPHMNAGGVYICEDVHGVENNFYKYCSGLAKGLNNSNTDHEDVIRPNSLQRWVKGVYFYPFIIVIERSERPLEKLTAPKHGTIWKPW